MSKPRSQKRATGPRPAAVEATTLEVRRGDVLWMCCDPSVGAEPKKTRTCVVVSNDIANRFAQAITVIPTQKWSAERAARAYMTDLRAPRSTLKDGRVGNASMIMTYDRARIVARAGRVSADALRLIDQALGVHLGLAAV